MPTSINGFGFVDENGNKSIGINLSNCRRMTYSEYQQLSESERSGAIIITDYPIPEESDEVYVTGDGVKTYGTLVNELYALADISKISENTVITREDPNGTKYVFHINRIQSDNYNFTTIRNTTTDNTSATIWFNSSNSAIIEFTTTTTGTTTYNQSSVAMASGTKIFLIYNYYKNQDIHTEYSADHCMMSDGVTSVESVISDHTIISNSVNTPSISTGHSSALYAPISLTKGLYYIEGILQAKIAITDNTRRFEISLMDEAGAQCGLAITSVPHNTPYGAVHISTVIELSESKTIGLHTYFDGSAAYEAHSIQVRAIKLIK